MSQSTPHPIDQFLKDLERQESSRLTILNYRSDLNHFSRWFEGSNGEPFSPAALTPTDIRDYRSHLVAVERRAPATVNRRLSAFKRFSQWAKAEGLIDELPTDDIKGVASTPRAPKWLEKREVDRLLRAAERGGNKRDLAILHTLYGTGLRVSELCALTLEDVTFSLRAEGAGDRQIGQRLQAQGGTAESGCQASPGGVSSGSAQGGEQEPLCR
jgi:site-specific recombinase XerD